MVWDPSCLYSHRTVLRWGQAIWNATVSLEFFQFALEGAANQMGANEVWSADPESTDLKPDMFDAN